MTAHVIRMNGSALPSYLSETVGLNMGAGQYGGWTMDISEASGYEFEAAQKLLDGPLASVAPFCEVIPK